MTLKYSTFINEIPEEQPREKLDLYGAEVLNDVDLLSIILGTGYKGLPVKDLATKLLAEFGSKGLLQFSKLSDVQEYTGLPFVKSCQILAIAELFRRVTKKDDFQIKSSDQLYEYVKDLFKGDSFEKLYIICVDNQRRVIHSSIIAQGKPNTLSVSLAAVFHYPIKFNLQHFYLVHNHPQGTSQPSEDDINFTKQIKNEALKYGLFCDDHLIIGENDFFSFALRGYL